MAQDTGIALDATQSTLAKLKLLDKHHGTISRETARYLRELTQNPLDVIEHQPAQQQTSVFSLEHQLSDLCVRNTSAFVSAQEAFDKIPQICS